jgi:hypothetical protein
MAFLAAGLMAAGSLRAAPIPLTAETRLNPAAPAWQELAAKFARRGDITATFEERRVFPFRSEPVTLRGEVRVSATRGLSLHYTAPQERTIIIDGQGFLVRESKGGAAPPPDPRANAANEAMRSILRMDFAQLAAGYELHGQQDGDAWSLGLVPRDHGLRRAIGDIFVEGEGAAVRRIELRRSARQNITISIASPQPATFSEEEIRTYFR